MPGTPANAAVPSTTSWLGYWCTIARRCFSVSRSCAFVTSRNACSTSLALGALRRTGRGAESRVQSPRLRERGRVARAGACPAPRAKKDELSMVFVLVLVWFGARIFGNRPSADPRFGNSFRSRIFFRVSFPRVRFALDTPGTPAFDSVSRVCALSPGIPAISILFHRIRVAVRPERVDLERRVHASVHRHADRHAGRGDDSDDEWQLSQLGSKTKTHEKCYACIRGSSEQRRAGSSALAGPRAPSSDPDEGVPRGGGHA